MRIGDNAYGIAQPRYFSACRHNRATISKDLKYATLYVTVEGENDKTVEALNASAGFIRREVATAMRNMRVIPVLRFKADSSAEYGRKIDSILKELENDTRSDT